MAVVARRAIIEQSKVGNANVEGSSAFAALKAFREIMEILK